jgi:MFS family permease
MTVPLYQAELAHPRIRGLVTGLQQFMLGVGGVVGSWLSYGTFVGFEDDRQWRIPLGVQIVPGAIVAGMILLFPESPRWLFQQGKEEQGTEILAKLHANGNTSDAWVIAEAMQIRAQVHEEKENEAKSFKALLSTKANRRRIIIACAIQAATQMTGISAIQYFSTTIFVRTHDLCSSNYG